MSDINPDCGGSYMRDAKTGQLTRIADAVMADTEAAAAEAPTPATTAPAADTTKKKDA